MAATENHSVSIDSDESFLKEIEELKGSPLNAGDVWFLVEYHWYHKMMDFLQGNSDYPGPIDNSHVLEQDGSRLKDGLFDETDYILLPERAWNKIHAKFGLVDGQSPISRKVIGTGFFVKHQTVEVYSLELNLSLASDAEKCITVPCSRVSTPRDLKKEARASFQLGSAAQIRLYQKQDNGVLELVPEDKAGTTLMDLCFTSRQQVIVDVEENGEWRINPEDCVPSGSNQQQVPGSGYGTTPSSLPWGYGRGPTNAPGLCGLTNLGNTCFMNSALQCLVHAMPLATYFLSDSHKNEINDTNPLGMQGEVAQAFGELCKQMWSGRSPCTAPRQFKCTVGRFAPQFSGYQQQDSQELMAFLLDGLHEDLNRIRNKPYIEGKDSDNEQEDEVVAAEAWSNYKKRNDSVIVDLCHGLLKSTVVCPECNKVSVTFDPFCYLSLPLPSKKERQIAAHFVPADPQKPILKVKVTVPKTGTFKDISEGIARMVGTNPWQLIVCEIYGNRVYKLFEPSNSLSLLMDRDDIYVYEVETVPQTEQPVTVIFYNRIEQRGYFAQTAPQHALVGIPAMAVLPKSRLSHAYLKAVAERAFLRCVTYPPAGERWWQSESGSDSGVEENGESGAGDTENPMDAEESTSTEPSMFVIRVVNSHGTSTFEEIRPSVVAPYTVDHGTRELYVSLDWHRIAAEKFLDLDVHRHVQEHESFVTTLTKKPLRLDDCLDLFTTTEKLGEDDLWYCPRCKKHQQATKKFDLWSLPDILIIHLKRFSYTRVWRDKIEGLVEYPLRNLDLNKWIINKKHPPCVYDLIAVSNHYGGLGGGHYTACAKVDPAGKWYNFDDSTVSQMEEDAVVTKSGYVLVYLRRRGPAVIDAGADPNVEMEEGEE